MDLGLSGKKAIVTGSTRGIGRAIANLLADEGADIAICSRNQEEVDSAVSELGAKGAGEAGLAGAVGAVLNAVNDALAPRGAFLTEVPLSPPRIIRALDGASSGWNGS